MTESPTVRVTLDRLLDGVNLSEGEAAQLLTELTDPQLAPALAGALLATLRAKGITAAELRGFAQRMRALARRPSCHGCPTRSISSAPAGIVPAVSICPPVRRCSPLPAVCRCSNTVIVRSRAARAAPMCSRRWACRCRWTRRPQAAASRRCISRSCSHPTTTRPPGASRRCAPRWACARCSTSSVP